MLIYVYNNLNNTKMNPIMNYFDLGINDFIMQF